MKKSALTILLIAFLLPLCSNAQISLEQTFTNGIYGLVKLSNSGYKYVDCSGCSWRYNGYPGDGAGYLRIRSLDGTIFRSIALPTPPSPGADIIGLYYVSETLFDNDSTTIEFLINYVYGTSSFWTIVASENGTILLSEPDASTFEVFTTTKHYSVYNTDQGVKLQLWYQNAIGYYQTKIFSVVGQLPTAIEDINIMHENNATNSVFPNPSTDNVNISLSLPEFVTDAEIRFYNLNGEFLKTISINPHDKLIQIDNSLLQSGTYLYEVKTKPTTQTEIKKMIIVK